MLVAKLPVSTYATAATNAGPRKGSSARRPRVWPLRAFSAARRTRSSPGSATATGSGVDLGGWVGVLEGAGGGFGASTATWTGSFHEHAARQPERDADPPALDPDLDGTLVLALLHDFDASAGDQAAPVQLTEPAGVVVRDALHDHLLTRAAFAERALAQRAHLAPERWDGVTVGIELRSAKQLEDPVLHALRDNVFEATGLVVDLIPAVAQHPDQEHFQQAVMPDHVGVTLAAPG